MGTITLESILSRSPLISPSTRKVEMLSTTRDITEYDRELPEHEKIHAVYLQDNLVDQLLPMAKKRAKKVKFTKKDWSTIAVMDVRLLEESLCAGLPGVINSESDIQTLLQLKFIGPALRGIVMEKLSKGTDRRLGSTKPRIQPVISSGPNFKQLPVPDNVLFDYVTEEDIGKDEKWWIEKAGCIIEYKGPKVMENMDLDILADLCEKPIVSDTFRAARFVHLNKEGNISCDTYGKVSTQINSQMYAFQIKYGILSSYSYTMFYCRKKVDNLNILYHSNKYPYKSITPLHFYAWILMCLEGSKDFKLKRIETKNIKDSLSNHDDLVMGLSKEPPLPPSSPVDTKDNDGSDFIPPPPSKLDANNNPERPRTRSHNSANNVDRSDNAHRNDNDETLERGISYTSIGVQTSNDLSNLPTLPPETENEDEEDADMIPEGESTEAEDIVESQHSPSTRRNRTPTRRASFGEPTFFDGDDDENSNDDPHGNNPAENIKPLSDSVLRTTEANPFDMYTDLDLEVDENTMKIYEKYDRENPDDAEDKIGEETELAEASHLGESIINNPFLIRSAFHTPERKNVPKQRQGVRVNSSPVSPKQLKKQGKRPMIFSSPEGAPQCNRRRKFWSPPTNRSKFTISFMESLKSRIEGKQDTLGPRDPGGSKRHYKKSVSSRAELSKAAGKKKETIKKGERFHDGDESEGEDDEWVDDTGDEAEEDEI